MGHPIDCRYVLELPSPLDCDRETTGFCHVRCWMRQRVAGCWLVVPDLVLTRWQEHGEKELDFGWVEDSVGLEEA